MVSLTLTPSTTGLTLRSRGWVGKKVSELFGKLVLTTSVDQFPSGMNPMEKESMSASEMVTTESESVTLVTDGDPRPFSMPAVSNAFWIMSV